MNGALGKPRPREQAKQLEAPELMEPVARLPAAAPPVVAPVLDLLRGDEPPATRPRFEDRPAQSRVVVSRGFFFGSTAAEPSTAAVPTGAPTQIQPTAAVDKPIMIAPSWQCGGTELLIPTSVPDVEWWDRELLVLPRYQNAKLKKDAISSLVHHPRSAVGVSTNQPIEAVALPKTDAELRRERHLRKLEKRAATEALQRLGELPKPEDRITPHNRELVQAKHGWTPTEVFEAMQAQKAERVEKHVVTNWENHLAALPRQEVAEREKKERLLKEFLQVSVHRIRNVTVRHPLGTIQLFAKERFLKCKILWIGEQDAVIISAGGWSPMRQLDHEIVNVLTPKLAAIGAVATRCFSAPVQPDAVPAVCLRSTEIPGRDDLTAFATFASDTRELDHCADIVSLRTLEEAVAFCKSQRCLVLWDTVGIVQTE
jgi:hypothetical protein